MAEPYTGPVAYWVDPDTGEGSYRALPEATDWEDKGMEFGKTQAEMSDQHPHSQLTPEDFRTFDEVIWVDEPETRETVELGPNHVPIKIYDGPAPGTPGAAQVTPEDQEGFTANAEGVVTHYTFGPRTTQTGGGHFELKSASAPTP